MSFAQINDITASNLWKAVLKEFGKMNTVRVPDLELEVFQNALAYNGVDVVHLIKTLYKLHAEKRAHVDFTSDMAKLIIFFMEWGTRYTKALTRIKESEIKNELKQIFKAYGIQENSRADRQNIITTQRICLAFPQMALAYANDWKQMKPTVLEIKDRFKLNSVPLKVLFSPCLSALIPSTAMENAEKVEVFSTDMRDHFIAAVSVIQHIISGLKKPKSINAKDYKRPTKAQVMEYQMIAMNQSYIPNSQRIDFLIQAGLFSMDNGIHHCIGMMSDLFISIEEDFNW